MRQMVAWLAMTLIPLGWAAAGEPLGCNAKALTPAEGARSQELMQALVAAAEDTRELPDGYAFRMPAASWMKAAEWVSLERRCCPFFTFALEQTRDEGPVWLRITGPDGVKAFLREELGL